MTARHALRPMLAASPISSGLFLLVAMNLGCVNLNQPWALAHPDGSVAGSSGGGNGTSSVAGSGGTTSAGGAGGSSAVDAGQGGSTNSSSSDSDSQGGSSAMDTSSAGTGGTGSEGGAGGTGEQTGTAGSTGTGAGTGTGGTAAGGTAAGGTAAGGTAAGGTGGKTGTAGSTGTGGTGTGGTGGAAGTSGKGGSAGQTSDVPDAGPDAAPDTALARDTLPPDAYCALCAIGANLVHRYPFNGSGTAVTDSVGTAHGTVTGTTLSGAGTLVLAGGTSNQYVQLPAHIFNTLTNATLEIWVTWTGGNNNQRILDFGSSKTSGSSTSAVTTVIISPNSYVDSAARLRASYCSDTSVSNSSIFADSTGTLTTGSQQQIVAVFDGEAHTLTMYVNGVAEGQPATGLGALSLIDDVNNYLGKSQYSGDPGFAGTYHEFRIYNAALTAAQVQTIFTAGPNASFN